MKWDKNYWVTCAVYRMLKGKQITPQMAKKLLHTRAKINQYTSNATVELWVRYPLRYTWGIDASNS